MKLFIRSIFVFFLLASLSIAGPDLAWSMVTDDFCTTEEKKYLQAELPLPVVLGNLYGAGCLGGDKDVASQFKTLNELWKKGMSQEEVELQAKNAFSLILETGNRTLAEQDDEHLRQLLQRIDEASRALIMENNMSTEDKNKLLKPESWRFDFTSNRFPEIDASPDPAYRDDICRGDVSATCKQSYDKAKTFLSYSYAAWRITDRLNEVVLVNVDKYLESLNKQWDSYFNEARSQFPWELLLNGYFYGKSIEGKLGLQKPPQSQIILLHPSPAFEYVPDADSGSEFEPAVVVELLGYNFWSWEGTKMKNPWGASIIASLSDRAGTDDLGLGGVVHYKNTFSVGVTGRDGAVGVFISADIGKWINKYSGKTKEAYQRGMSVLNTWF